ncbi:hypothetical protein BDV26DRAFT_49279 [Aspergillus bertholletiae]|uniref:Uncharacterized protein n=1 Tax=Aspergillus bertholletiae TaxID=1226010 RepID=A0A5N7BJK1_9EURO|nr:hypothetical protein BDV26DRAFT_49279 [Aspergillus bertholletiae]
MPNLPAAQITAHRQNKPRAYQMNHLKFPINTQRKTPSCRPSEPKNQNQKPSYRAITDTLQSPPSHRQNTHGFSPTTCRPLLALSH